MCGRKEAEMNKELIKIKRQEIEVMTYLTESCDVALNTHPKINSDIREKVEEVERDLESIKRTLILDAFFEGHLGWKDEIQEGQGS